MSRLTGSDALGLFEAYKAVYVPQELTEEQIWEEVENWVNSLLEEGYDLSDYTWEEMYESYLNEMGQTRTTGQNSSVFTLPQTPSAGSAGGSGSGGRRGSGSNPSVRYSTPNPSFQQSGGFGRYAAPSAQVKTPTPAARPAPAAGTPARSASAPAKPAAAPARSASAPATPKPTPTASASSTPSAKPSAMDQWAKANPRLAQAQQIRQQGGSRAEVNKALYNKGTAAAEKTPTVVKASFDMFDVIKGHLLDEGYADTEESAIAIMANMSEEWRQSIVEERAPGVRPYKPGPTQAEVRVDARRASTKKSEKDKDKSGYGPEDKFKSDWKLRAVPSSTSTRKDGEVETVSQRMNREAPYKTRPFSPLFTKQGSRTASAVTRATEGPGEPQAVTMPRKKSKPSREIVRKRKDTNESYDYYDLVLSYLLDEGYANSVEAAESIMASMSEDWVSSIIG